MTANKFDFAIIGGGPAGSSAAIRLAKAGRTVLLVEKANFPRHKLCGEFVSPECLQHFRELKVDPNINALIPSVLSRTIFYSVKGHSLTVRNDLLDRSGSNSIGLSRANMDLALVDRARELGVDVRMETTFRGPLIRDGRLEGVLLRSPCGESSSIRTRFVLDATGRARVVSRSLDNSGAPKGSLVAFKTHLRNAAIEKGACEIYSYQAGYGGCAPIEDRSFNLCFIAHAASVKEIGSDPEKAFSQLLMQNRRAQEALASAEFIGNWHAVPIASFGREQLVPFSGVFALGDAAAFIDPFTGSGIALALESSRLAVKAILSNDSFAEAADAYQKLYRSAFDRRLQFCKLLRLASKATWAASAMLAVLGSSSHLTRAIARATRFNSLRSST